MKVTQDNLGDFPPNSNPFNHDAFHMGQSFGKNHMLMFPNHSSKPLKYFILVDTSTGKRIRFTVESDEASQEEDISPVRQSVRQAAARIVDEMAGGGIVDEPIEPEGDSNEDLRQDLIAIAEEIKGEGTGPTS